MTVRVLVLVLFAALLGAEDNWRCVFNPSLCGGPDTPPDRTEVCDQVVPEVYSMIFGPPPVGAGCLSNPERLTYYSELETYVRDSEVLFEGEAAELFKEFGFGPGVKFTRKWGKHERELIGFPTPDWKEEGIANPVVFGLAATFPGPYLATGQTRAIKEGACISKLHPAVPPKYATRNRENCGVAISINDVITLEPYYPSIGSGVDITRETN